jgi:hypothetical protein
LQAADDASIARRICECAGTRMTVGVSVIRAPSTDDDVSSAKRTTSFDQTICSGTVVCSYGITGVDSAHNVA